LSVNFHADALKVNKINLDDIIDGMEFQSGEGFSYIDKRTNTVCLITQEALSLAEDGDENYPEWMKEMIQLAKSFLEDDTDFIELPSQYDVHEYKIMENFAFSLNDGRNEEKLLMALRGKGAFRKFKDTVIYLGMQDNWYQYREEQIKEFVLSWCKINGIHVEQS
jgi:phage anti-repressor protein